MVLLLLFPVVCWVALRLWRLIRMNEGFPYKRNGLSKLLWWRNTCARSVKQSWRWLTQLLKMMLSEAREASDATVPARSWSAKYYHIYTHPVAVSQVGQGDSRGTRDGGYLAQWRTHVSHGLKANIIIGKYSSIYYRWSIRSYQIRRSGQVSDDRFVTAIVSLSTSTINNTVVIIVQVERITAYRIIYYKKRIRRWPNMLRLNICKCLLTSSIVYLVYHTIHTSFPFYSFQKAFLLPLVKAILQKTFL